MDAPSFEFPSELISYLRAAVRVAALTGSGISAESGVPTFREAQTGLWAQFSPEELATPEAFRKDPRLVWEWYAWRRDLVGRVAPNPGHYALVAIEKRVPNFTLITQNVDGLHHRAGNLRVLELHGNLQRVKCFEEEKVVALPASSETVPPRCPDCGGLLRPDVVWFGEPLPVEALQAAWEAAETCDVFFSIGTSALVQPAAGLPLLALREGAIVIEINPNETPLTSSATFALRGKAGAVLPALVQAAWE